MAAAAAAAALGDNLTNAQKKQFREQMFINSIAGPFVFSSRMYMDGDDAAFNQLKQYPCINIQNNQKWIFFGNALQTTFLDSLNIIGTGNNVLYVDMVTNPRFEKTNFEHHIKGNLVDVLRIDRNLWTANNPTIGIPIVQGAANSGLTPISAPEDSYHIEYTNSLLRLCERMNDRDMGMLLISACRVFVFMTCPENVSCHIESDWPNAVLLKMRSLHDSTESTPIFVWILSLIDLIAGHNPEYKSKIKMAEEFIMQVLQPDAVEVNAHKEQRENLRLKCQGILRTYCIELAAKCGWKLSGAEYSVLGPAYAAKIDSMSVIPHGFYKTTIP